MFHQALRYNSYVFSIHIITSDIELKIIRGFFATLLSLD